MLGKGMGLKGSSPEMQKITWIALCFAVIKISCSHYRQRELLRMILLNLLGIAVWFCSGETSVLMLFITISAMKGIPYKYALKITFWIFGGLFFVRATLAMLGMMDSQLGYYYDVGIVPRIRYSLGYDHPNTAHFVLFLTIAAGIILYHAKMKWYMYVAVCLYNYWIFRFTRSRSGFLIVLIFLLGSILLKSRVRDYINKGLQLFADKAFLFTSGFSLLAVYLFSRVEFLRSLGTFSSRFMTGVRVVQRFSLLPFGTRGVVTDLGVIAFLYSDGVLFFLILVFGYYHVLRKHAYRNDAYYLLAVCCYAVYCLTENYADSVLMNITLLPFAALIYQENRNEIIS